MSTYTAHTLVIPADGDLEYAVSTVVDGMYGSTPTDAIVTKEEAIQLLEGLIITLKKRIEAKQS